MSKPKDAATSAPQEILPPKPGKAVAKGKPGSAKPESDPELEGLMSEIESDLREEELRKIWQRYGKTIIAAVVVMVIGVAGAQLWRQRATEQRLELASRYETALKDLDAGKLDDAAGIFADVATKRGEGYATLAQLQRAALLLQKNDIDGAVALYKDIAADTKADSTFRDLAVVLEALHTIDRADPKALEARLAPLTSSSKPFHSAATELTALLAAKQGDTARAAQLMQQLLDDPATPQNMRQRAEDFAAYYRTAAPPPPAKKP